MRIRRTLALSDCAPPGQRFQEQPNPERRPGAAEPWWLAAGPASGTEIAKLSTVAIVESITVTVAGANLFIAPAHASEFSRRASARTHVHRRPGFRRSRCPCHRLPLRRRTGDVLGLR